MDPIKQIEHHVEEATNIAYKHIETLARKIISENKEYCEFIMAMGTYAFYDKDGESIRDPDNHPITQPLDDFISDWDDQLYLTGMPMRIVGDGPIITEW